MAKVYIRSADRAHVHLTARESCGSERSDVVKGGREARVKFRTSTPSQSSTSGPVGPVGLAVVVGME